MDWLLTQIAILGDIVWYLLPVVPMTVAITLAAFALALVVGTIIALMRLGKYRPLARLAKLYVDILRGVPLLVQIFFIYFGLGQILNLDRIAAGIIAVGICYSAYLAESIRAGIGSIEEGQYQAASALGFTKTQTMRHVIFPQALRVILPPGMNEFIACLKDSSLVSIIGLREITRAGREYITATFLDFQTWLMVAAMYLVMTLLLSRVARYLEKRYAVHGYKPGH